MSTMPRQTRVGAMPDMAYGWWPLNPDDFADLYPPAEHERPCAKTVDGKPCGGKYTKYKTESRQGPSGVFPVAHRKTEYYRCGGKVPHFLVRSV